MSRTVSGRSEANSRLSTTDTRRGEACPWTRLMSSSGAIGSVSLSSTPSARGATGSGAASSSSSPVSS